VQSHSTCWILIRGAASGGKKDREAFARRYEPILRAYLGARWRNSPLRAELDDAVQDVFVECFREGGVLDRVDPSRPGGFRAFLYGVTRNIALRFEKRAGKDRERRADTARDPDDMPVDEATLSRIFDGAWASAILQEAAQLQEERAAKAGEEAVKRVEMLRLRFSEDLPIHEIARLWNADPTRLHKEFARARQEFKAALLEVVAFHHPGTAAEIQTECAQLLALVRRE
jgi:RNA polymerase sigma factor (sigma-70 family)